MTSVNSNYRTTNFGRGRTELPKFGQNANKELIKWPKDDDLILDNKTFNGSQNRFLEISGERLRRYHPRQIDSNPEYPRSVFRFTKAKAHNIDDIENFNISGTDNFRNADEEGSNIDAREILAIPEFAKDPKVREAVRKHQSFQASTSDFAKVFTLAETKGIDTATKYLVDWINMTEETTNPETERILQIQDSGVITLDDVDVLNMRKDDWLEASEIFVATGANPNARINQNSIISVNALKCIIEDNNGKITVEQLLDATKDGQRILNNQIRPRRRY